MTHALAWLLVVAALGPTIEHVPLERAEPAKALRLEARVTSLSGTGLFGPFVYLRTSESPEYARLPMRALEADGFELVLPAPKLPFEYYLEVFDADGRGPSRVGSPEAPLRVLPALPVIATPAPSTDTPQRSKPQHWLGLRRGLGFGAGGLALVCLGTAVGFGVHSLAEFEDARRLVPVGGDAFFAAQRGSRDSALVADVLYGVAALSAVVAVTLLLLGDDPSAVAVSLGPTGVGVGGRF